MKTGTVGDHLSPHMIDFHSFAACHHDGRWCVAIAIAIVIAIVIVIVIVLIVVSDSCTIYDNHEQQIYNRLESKGNSFETTLEKMCRGSFTGKAKDCSRRTVSKPRTSFAAQKGRHDQVSVPIVSFFLVFGLDQGPRFVETPLKILWILVEIEKARRPLHHGPTVGQGTPNQYVVPIDAITKETATTRDPKKGIQRRRARFVSQAHPRGSGSSNGHGDAGGSCALASYIGTRSVPDAQKEPRIPQFRKPGPVRIRGSFVVVEVSRNPANAIREVCQFRQRCSTLGWQQPDRRFFEDAIPNVQQTGPRCLGIRDREFFSIGPSRQAICSNALPAVYFFSFYRTDF
mmetsp:Transcript_13840/g.31947  ORF Transcript_13840/g.31947 Transcript_13840/m.31947 type:complete len:344 (+) Transcript_13840:650-1681(+)